MPRRTYIGEIRGGKLHLSGPRRQQMAFDISKMKEGRLVEVELRPLPRRSGKLNNYYWGVMVAMVMEALQELGHDVDADLTHEFLKSKFNAKPLCNAEGELIGEIGGSTAIMNNSEFLDYKDRIQRWGIEFLNIRIPDPNEQTEIAFEEPQNIEDANT